jgi:hypothetical protein
MRIISKLFSLIFCLIVIISANADTGLIELYETPWHMMEDIFVIRPEEQAKSVASRLLRWSFSGFGGVATYKASEWGINYFNIPYLANNDKLAKGLSGFTGGAVALVLNNLTYRLMLKQNERKALSWFLAKWPQHRKYTPESLKRAFDKLHNNYSKDTLLGRSTNKAIRLIKENVYRCFPQKYKDQLNKNFFDMRIFNVDLGNTLTGIANLIKVAKSK